MKIITFSGIDGSGKSSQLTALRKNLEATGASVAYFHAVQWSLPQAAKKLFQRTPLKPGEARAITKSSSLGIVLRKAILLLDLLRFKRYIKRLQKEKVDYLLSDRYFYDSLVNIAYLDGTSLANGYARLAVRLIPRPAHAFLLSVDPEKIMRRERAPEQGLKYLKDKYALFLEAATLWNFTVIDADRDIETIQQDIKTRL